MSLYSDCSEFYSCSQNCSYAGICAPAISTHSRPCMANKRPCRCTVAITPAQSRRVLMLNTEHNPFQGHTLLHLHHTSNLESCSLLITAHKHADPSTKNHTKNQSQTPHTIRIVRPSVLTTYHNESTTRKSSSECALSVKDHRKESQSTLPVANTVKRLPHNQSSQSITVSRNYTIANTSFSANTQNQLIDVETLIQCNTTITSGLSQSSTSG
jgi:hypothetical protein